MTVHHVALWTAQPALLSAWYAELFGLVEIRRSEDEHGVRSVWLNLDGVVLMVERGAPRDGGARGEAVGGWHGLYLAGEPGSGPRWAGAFTNVKAGPTKATEYTIYGVDPDGNEFGVSSFPAPLFPKSSAPPLR